MKKVFFLVVGVVFFAGCAGITPPAPEDIIKNPLGGDEIKIGFTKEQVLSLWGEPDSKSIVKSDKWSREREEWVYVGRYNQIPISAGYLSKTKYLYFDGDNLTNISDKRIE